MTILLKKGIVDESKQKEDDEMKGKSKRASAKNNTAPQYANHTGAENAELNEQKSQEDLSNQTLSNPASGNLTEEMFLQFGEKEVSIASISEKVKQSYHDSSHETELKDIKIYIKPEDNKAYYVANEEIEGSVDLTSDETW